MLDFDDVGCCYVLTVDIYTFYLDDTGKKLIICIGYSFQLSTCSTLRRS